MQKRDTWTKHGNTVLISQAQEAGLFVTLAYLDLVRYLDLSLENKYLMIVKDLKNCTWSCL